MLPRQESSLIIKSCLHIATVPYPLYPTSSQRKQYAYPASSHPIAAPEMLDQRHPIQHDTPSLTMVLILLWVCRRLSPSIEVAVESLVFVTGLRCLRRRLWGGLLIVEKVRGWVVGSWWLFAMCWSKMGGVCCRCGKHEEKCFC